ncbi:MAG TPA: cytochrome c biogenesis protein CcdA [Myxococcota bacterium]|nr:cytochrome c biogenesis protein CcdA [Myxococcota bacterium]
MIELQTALRIAGAVFFLIALILGVFRPNLFELSPLKRAIRAYLVVLAAMGIAMLLGIVQTPNKAKSPLEWRTDVEEALQFARDNQKPAILDAGASWCASCRQLEEKTLKDAEVVKALENHVTIHIDMTDFDPAQERLAKLGIQINELPKILFFMPDGRLNPGATLSDYEPPSKFLDRIKESATYMEQAYDPVGTWLSEKGIFIALILVFLAGLGVSLTPCVFPMFPIALPALAGIHRGDRSGQLSFSKRLARASAFLGGMVVTYTTLGIVSALLGKGFGSWLQHPIVTWTLVIIFLLLAMSYLKFFNLSLPSGLTSKLGRRGDGLLGLALFGGGIGIIAAPCAGPVVVGILAMISTAGNVALGAIFMVAFSLGLGSLFFALSLFTSMLDRLPRGGPFMERIEIGFAIALTTVAIYYASTVM